VHVAARVGEVGGPDEIVVSAESFAGADPGFPISEPRTVSLKGVVEPLAVHTVDWS
jgi:hypothetical protein